MYYYGGGREGIICVSFLMMLVFATNTTFVIDFLNRQVEIMCYFVFAPNNPQTQNLIKTVTLFSCGVLLYPFCLIKNFHKIKLLGFGLFILEQLILIYMLFACWYGNELIIDKQFENPFIWDANAPWLNMVPFSRIFSLQGFFMIIYGYLEERSKINEGSGVTKG